jgi:hypothetical protein
MDRTITSKPALFFLLAVTNLNLLAVHEMEQKIITSLDNKELLTKHFG